MEYYFLRNVDDANTGLPMGYDTGLIDEFNKAPAGAVIVNSIDELAKLEQQANDEDAKLTPTDPLETIDSPKEECPVQIPEGRRWFESEVTVAIDPSLPRADQVHLKKCFEVHQKWVAKNSALTHSIISNYNSAKIKITKGPIDGRNGTLAQAELSIQTQQERIISVTVRFDEEDGTDHFTGLHEFCHADGVAHQTTDPEGLMYPSKNNATYYGEYELGEYGTKYPKQKLA